MTDENEGIEPQEEVQAEVTTDAGTETEAQPLVAESSTASDGEHEQKPNGVQERINKITAQKYAEKARADEAEKRAKELEEKLNSNADKPTTDSGIVPPSPDLYYEDAERYNSEMANYHAEVARQQLNQERLERENLARQQERESAQQQSIREFEESATKDGLDLDAAYSAAESLQNWGINPSLEQAVMSHPNKAALMDYLAKNPHEFESLNKHNQPFMAWDGLKELAPKALSKKVSQAPEPIPDVKGGSAKEPDGYDDFFSNSTFG